MNQVHILGGGPAGSSAALAALSNGASVELIEKSQLPRHKVCGEFLSPEIQQVLERIGVWDGFCEQRPARIARMVLQFGTRNVSAKLPEPAYGLSRFRFDSLLFDAAVRRGAVWTKGSRSSGKPLIEATGRITAAERGKRLFGFKAHFSGPIGDAVELFFFRDCYVGLNTVENGITNVCGLGPERELKKFGFDIDALANSCPALRERISPLRREMKWLHVGPLVFRNGLGDSFEQGTYPCGDALSFVDPFTGSGLLSGVVMGELAGHFAANGRPVDEYLASCRKVLKKPFVISTVFRSVARHRWAGLLASAVPGDLLFRWTRPRSAA